MYSWAAELEPGALSQAANCASLQQVFHHVAVMADGHQGYGVPIGAVVALDGALSPYAVGNDIGCGMALVATRLTSGDLLSRVPTRSGTPGPTARDELMGWVQHAIPAGADRGRGEASPRGESVVDEFLYRGLEALEEAAATSGVRLSTSQPTGDAAGRPLTREDLVARGRSQAGTLGSGNHFVELLRGPDDDVWVLVHSGSRGFGGTICANFHRMALAHCREIGVALVDPGLAWLPVAPGDGDEGRWERVGRCYAQAMAAALDYARANRRTMLESIAEVFERRFPDPFVSEGAVNIHHNDATCEEHFGHGVWVHRKGAVKASAGAPTITPGSMGTGSILGRGLGNPDAFSSAAHGAGRAMSRARAKRELSLDDQLATVKAAGGRVFAASRRGVLDEMPGAYKDLDEVMHRQSDLVEPVRRFTPLATYKGVDRRRGKRGPDEER